MYVWWIIMMRGNVVWRDSRSRQLSTTPKQCSRAPTERMAGPVEAGLMRNKKLVFPWCQCACRDRRAWLLTMKLNAQINVEGSRLQPWDVPSTPAVYFKALSWGVPYEWKGFPNEWSPLWIHSFSFYSQGPHDQVHMHWKWCGDDITTPLVALTRCYHGNTVPDVPQWHIDEVLALNLLNLLKLFGVMAAGHAQTSCPKNVVLHMHDLVMKNIN